MPQFPKSRCRLCGKLKTIEQTYRITAYIGEKKKPASIEVCDTCKEDVDKYGFHAVAQQIKKI